MGNEDILVCKNVCASPKIVSDIGLNEIHQINDSLEGMKLKSTDGKDENEKRIDFVQILPVEVIEEIFLYLSPKDLAACTSVSSTWREAVNSNKVWGHLCNQNGWRDNFDPSFSHFYKAHRQFRKWAHSYDSFSPICHKRLLYNKHSCLRSNWRNGKCIIHKIKYRAQVILQLFEPVTCDGKHLVMLEKSLLESKKDVSLAVWNLNGVPSKLCNLPLPHKVENIDAIAFDHETIVVAQSWLIVVYKLQNENFKKAFELQDLYEFQPINKLPKEMRKMTPYLKISEEFIISVPSQSHSTVDFIPILFWDRETGEKKHSLTFNSMYDMITNVEWFSESCYLSLSNRKKKEYQIVEFNFKTATWEPFSQNTTVDIDKIAVSNQYVLAVTKLNSPPRDLYPSREGNYKEIWLWDRVTGSALTTFEVQGKGFQFVDDFLMFFESSKVSVMDPKSPSICSQFEVSGTISSIRPSNQSKVMVIVKAGCYIEVWDWGLGTRLYTVTAETGYGGSHLWCDNQRIISYQPPNQSSGTGGGILVLGFW